MTPNPEQIESNTPAQVAQPGAPSPAPANPADQAEPATPVAAPSAPAPQPQQAPTTSAATGQQNPYGSYAPYGSHNPSGVYAPYAPYGQQYPSGASSAYPQYPQYPQYQYPQYPQYQYPQYPGYSGYPYPGYPPYAAPAPSATNGATPPASGADGAATAPAAAKSRRTGLYALIFGVALAVLLVAAIALAAIAPGLRASETGSIPQGWTRVYDANLTAGDDGQWDHTIGCAAASDGLEAGGPTSDSVGGVCFFKPSAATDLTSRGFLLDVTLAAPNNVPNNQAPVIIVGDSTFVTFTQQGAYTICVSQCSATGTAGGGGGGAFATGSSSAWHEDGFVGNTIGVEVASDGATLTLFVNGAAVTTVTIAASVSSQTPIAIGALEGAQAIYTHATFYSGSATSL